MALIKTPGGACKIEDLSGYGAFLYGGRWNEQGIPASTENPPVNMYFAEVYVPDDAGEGLFRKVPSAILPYEYEHDFNLIFNPQHPDFKKLKVLKVHELNFDNRLNKF